MRVPPPSDYRAFYKLLQLEFNGFNRSFQAVARFVVQNPNEVAVNSINNIAAQCGVHPSTLVRFAQSLGYAGFMELKDLFRRRLAAAVPGFKARVTEVCECLDQQASKGGRGVLRDLVAHDTATLQLLCDEISESDVAAATELMARAEIIFLAGYSWGAPVVAFLHYSLTVLGRPVVLLDASGGLATHMARIMRPLDLLMAASFRADAHEVVGIAEEACAAGVPVMAITGSALSPIARCATILLSVFEDGDELSQSLAAPMCLAQALMSAFETRIQRVEIDDESRPAGPMIPAAGAPEVDELEPNSAAALAVPPHKTEFPTFRGDW